MHVDSDINSWYVNITNLTVCMDVYMCPSKTMYLWKYLSLYEREDLNLYCM